jgi:hypothetical protein
LAQSLSGDWEASVTPLQKGYESCADDGGAKCLGRITQKHMPNPPHHPKFRRYQVPIGAFFSSFSRQI